MGLIPARGLLLVRPIDTDDTLPGGRIALIAETRERMTAWQCEAVEAGKFAACADVEECGRSGHVFDTTVENPAWPGGAVHPHTIHAGAWLLVRPRSYIAGPEPERKLWYVHQDDVWAILEED